MTIQEGKSLIHWNYFIALEADLEEISRYIEFTEDNFETYSIKLAQLLLATSSEVDVISKGICNYLDPESEATNIRQYREIIMQKHPEFANEQVFITRHGLQMQPWSNWNNNISPDWWQSYNNVKHNRNDFFNDANLEHVLNSISALLVSIFHYYRLEYLAQNPEITDRNVTRILLPESVLLRLSDAYYTGPSAAL